MNKLITFGLFSLFIFLSSFGNNRCQLSGYLDNIEDSVYLFLTDINSSKTVDSILVANGKFNHQLDLTHPKIFLLHKKNGRSKFRDQKVIWLEPSEISLKGDFNFMKNIKVQGSDSHSEYRCYTLMVDSLNRHIIGTKDSLVMYCLSKGTKYYENIHNIIPDSVANSKEFQLLNAKIDSLGRQLSDKIISFMSSNNKSYVTLYNLHCQSSLFYTYVHKRNLNKKQIRKIYELLTDELKYSNTGLEVKKYIDLPGFPQNGFEAPDIKQSSPDGKTIRLSDYKGQFVLIDFWSSDCRPCRVGSKGLRSIYEKYHPLGLEIIGVSGDRNKDDWVNAIKHDSLPWINISDLKGWKNEAFLEYDIKGIPTYILVDKKGIIKDKFIGDNNYLGAVLEKIIENGNGL